MITPEIEKALLEASDREDAFFARHGFSEYPKGMRETSVAPEPHREWVKVVEAESRALVEGGHTFCGAPLARKMFVLGYLKGMNRASESGTTP